MRTHGDCLVDAFTAVPMTTLAKEIVFFQNSVVKATHALVQDTMFNSLFLLQFLAFFLQRQAFLNFLLVSAVANFL